MNGSKLLLLGSLVATALLASAAVAAHPTGNSGGKTMGAGAMEGGAMMHQGQGSADMRMQQHRGHMDADHGTMHQGSMQDRGHDAGGGMGSGHMSSGQMGRGHMGSGHHRGSAKITHGMRVTPVQHLTVDDVTHFFGHLLERRGNKRLKLGEVSQKNEDTITAQIVTVDGSLVQTFEVDRHSGVAKRAN